MDLARSLAAWPVPAMGTPGAAMERIPLSTHYYEISQCLIMRIQYPPTNICIDSVHELYRTVEGPLRGWEAGRVATGCGNGLAVRGGDSVEMRVDPDQRQNRRKSGAER